MAVFKFFKLPRHQQYEYKPRYWDPKRDELEERLKQINDMKEGDAEAMKARLTAGFRKGGFHGDTRYRSKQVMRSNLTLIGIIVVLLLLSYLFITLYLPEIAESVGQ